MYLSCDGVVIESFLSLPPPPALCCSSHTPSNRRHPLYTRKVEVQHPALSIGIWEVPHPQD